MIDWGALLPILNLTALFLLVALLGAGIYGMVRRFVLFRRAQKNIPSILRRDLMLFGALALVGLESLGLRALGVDLTEADPFVRFLFVAHWDAILLAAFAYWVKVELLDVDDPDKP